ncbi:hypothetical protein BJ165DRAFT_1524898 [Panaeolus papilionaceus]|nr:hypothetical protein BJ165DRAFT_1524898 [Panaeolus papilionaceus]
MAKKSTGHKENPPTNPTKSAQAPRAPKGSALRTPLENQPVASQNLPADATRVVDKRARQKSRPGPLSTTADGYQQRAANPAVRHSDEANVIAANDLPGRPKRQRVSRIDKLNKDSEVIGGDLMRTMANMQRHKRKPSATVDADLFDIPEDAPVNSMAPPAKKQRVALPAEKNSAPPGNRMTTGLTSINPFSNVPSKSTVAPPPPSSQIPDLSHTSRQPSGTSSHQLGTPVTGPCQNIEATRTTHTSTHEDNNENTVTHDPIAGRKLVPGQRKAEVMHKRIGRRYLVPDSESENDDENDDENTMQCEEVNWDGGRTHNDMYKPYEFSDDFDYNQDNEEHQDEDENIQDDEDEHIQDGEDEDENIQDGEDEDDNIQDGEDEDDNIQDGEDENIQHDEDENFQDYENNDDVLDDAARNEQPLNTPVPNDQIDVLDDYRARNRARRPPREEHLAEVAHQQDVLNCLIRDVEEDPFGEQAVDEDRDDEDEGAQIEEDDDTDDRPKRAPRNSCHSGIRSPTTLAFYHGPWKMALASSKLHWRRNLAIGNAWPSRQNDIHFVKAILNARLLHYKNEGVVFNDEFQVNRHMWILIFQEASTFRGKLKDYVRPIIPMFYKDVIPDEYEGNQLAVFDAVIERVKTMLDDGTFHHGLEKDSLGKTNNFAHPCIGHVIQQFFYGKPDAVARSFPDDFSQEVPLRVIALVATAIVACLEEYLAIGRQRNLPFDAKGYMGTYGNLVKAIEKVHDDEYHGKKLLNLRRSWAAAGMALLEPVEEPNGRVIPIDLD